MELASGSTLRMSFDLVPLNLSAYQKLLILLTVLIFASSCRPQKLVSEPPKGYINEATLKLAYMSGSLKLVDAEPAIPEHFAAYQDIVYKETPQKDLKLDIYHLKSISIPKPLLIFIHGGSWKKGNKDDYRRYLVDYAEKGYVTATISYRFTQEAVFPAAFDDVLCAVKWLKAHADTYKIDPDNIALIGGSAGAHLAMMIAYHGNDPSYQSQSGCEFDTDVKVKAVVNLYGPVDLTTDFAKDHPTVTSFLGKTWSDANKKYFEAASPLHFITPDDPPTLTFHGTIDDTVPVSQADLLDEALKEKKVVSDYHRLKGWPHTMDLSVKVNQYCQHHMDAFFKKYLK